jgi:hypothetical protein
MTSLVIDASVAIKWFLPEEHSISAIRLLEAGHELLAPDLIFAECGNVLWNKWLRQELQPEVIPAILSDLRRMNMQIVPAAFWPEKPLLLLLAAGGAFAKTFTWHWLSSRKAAWLLPMNSCATP